MADQDIERHAANGTTTTTTTSNVIVTTPNGPRHHTYGSFPAPGDTSPPDDPSTGAASQPTVDAPVKPALKTRAVGPDLLRGALMAFMALDHVSIFLRAFHHGTGNGNEEDGVVVHEWNRPVAYAVRTISHLCGPGFTFLLGMGVAYLSESRTRLGWSSAMLVRYYAVRAAVLTAITVLMGVLFTGGEVWFLNMVLFSLAVDLFLTGLLWIVIRRTEPALASCLARFMPSSKAASADDGATEPLLGQAQTQGYKDVATRARDASRYIHHGFLLVLGVVTIWWNIWLSPYGGHCQAAASEETPAPVPSIMGLQVKNPWLRLWFWPVMEPGTHVASGFPPMAWLSFSILGLLYGRILLSTRRSRHVLATGYAVVAVAFTTFFVLTRVLRFGNLSESCMQTPEHQAHPNENPYLVSPESFFYIIKYPPDVAFWAFTLAGNFALLAFFEALPLHISKRLTLLLDFGSSALFFYILHLVVAAALGGVLTALFGTERDFPNPLEPDAREKSIESIPVFFATWAAVILIMWPLCRWYGRFKSQKPVDSVWRFF